MITRRTFLKNLGLVTAGAALVVPSTKFIFDMGANRLSRWQDYAEKCSKLLSPPTTDMVEHRILNHDGTVTETWTYEGRIWFRQSQPVPQYEFLTTPTDFSLQYINPIGWKEPRL